MNRILINWINILLFLSLIALGSAYIAEYIFELLPCKMCLKQRYSYYAIIIIIIVFYIFRQSKNIILAFLNQLAILYGIFYAFWHVGIEQKILKGPESCSNILFQTNSIKNLKEQISNQAIISCSDISWKILGLSAATINSLLLLLILIINTIFITKYYYASKKKYN